MKCAHVINVHFPIPWLNIMVTSAHVEAYLLDWLKVLGNFDIKFSMLLQTISVMDMRQEYESSCIILVKSTFHDH